MEVECLTDKVEAVQEDFLAVAVPIIVTRVVVSLEEDRIIKIEATLEIFSAEALAEKMETASSQATTTTTTMEAIITQEVEGFFRITQIQIVVEGSNLAIARTMVGRSSATMQTIIKVVEADFSIIITITRVAEAFSTIQTTIIIAEAIS